MRDLAAQVTSGLLRFPEVTVEAVGEDEVTLDSVLHGRFTTGRGGLAWLACGPQLEVVHAVTGKRFSAYRFSAVSEHPPVVLAVRDFSWLKRSGLLVGLEEEEGSMLCLYDLGVSRVVKAVVIPGRITAIEPLVSYGGASASTQHLHQSLRWFFGVAAVVTDVGHVLLVDLCLDDLSCNQTELEASDLEVVNKSPSEIPRLREGVTEQGRHLCLQLGSPSGVAATSLQYIPRTNQLAVGFSDGYLQLWNMKTLKKEYHSQLEGGRVPVYAFTFQEPENDPRNCCYLWAVQSAQDHEGDSVSLHLLQLAFGERKCLTSGKIMYEGLEYCEERYSQDLSGAAFPLRAHATNTRLLSCQTVEKYRHHPDREDSVNEVASPDTSVSIFSWQVKSYGQGQPSTFIGVFDINRWYHAQMPDSMRAGESLRNCPYLAVWSLDSVVEMTAPCPLLDVVVHERSLSRGLAYTCPPPEQYFSPTTYNFDASCLLNSGVVHVTCAGYQKETLGYLKKAVATLSDGISGGYSRCLMAGLLCPRLADEQPSNLSQEEQLDAILQTAVETNSLGMITGCIKQWTTDDPPGSARSLRYILEWAWDRTVQAKDELDRICAPLFDGSSNFTDPQTLQLLQQSQRFLSNMSTVFHCLLNQTQELTQRGLVALMNKSRVSSLISQYARVLLWFCRTGLLPEGSDDDVLQISRPFYSFSVIKNYYIGQREELKRLAKDKWCADCLMIDGLVGQCGERLADLWKRDEGGTGQYPPPSLHALLDLYLLENIDESAKHAIVIYLLLDVMYSFPNKSGASVESFPTAFAIPVGLVKLVQGLWLLDHHDHESSLELLLHPTTNHTLWSWQHERVLQAFMCQGKHSIALRYLHMMKPPISSTSTAKLCVSVLLHNRCIVEALALLRHQASKLNMEELLYFLYETCQDLHLTQELLRLPLGPSEQECLERFLQDTGGFQNRELLMVHYLQQAKYIPALQLNQTLRMNQAADRDPKLKERSNTRNSILSQYGKVLPRVLRQLAIERAKPYHHPNTILREVPRPRPLSTVAKRSATETVLTRAAFIKSVLSKIEEVWVGTDTPTQASPLRSPRGREVPGSSVRPPTLDLPEAFIGTPIKMLSRRGTRLLDLVVQPSCQTSPEVVGTPHRPVSSWPSPLKGPELNLLQTPQVVKRARALASSGSGFPSFTPQSILRSSLRPTPVATPSASPGRSVTPPLRHKESRITFIEEAGSPDLHKGSVHWSNGLVASSEMKHLKRSSLPPEGGVDAWSDHSGEEEKEPRAAFMPSVKDKSRPGAGSSCFAGEKGPAEGPKLVLPTLHPRPSLGLETSTESLQSDTLEFHNALSPGDLVRQALERRLSGENDMDEEVYVRPPGEGKSVVVSAEEAPAEREPDAGEGMNFEEEGEEKAQRHSWVDTQVDVSAGEVKQHGEEHHDYNALEEGPVEILPSPPGEESVSPSEEAVVLNHHPEVVVASARDDTEHKKPVLAEEVELVALESLGETISKDPVAEASGWLVTTDTNPSQPVTDVSVPHTLHENLEELVELPSASQEPNSQSAAILEEPILEEPILEEPILEEPILEEPILEEPILEEPIPDTPATPVGNHEPGEGLSEAVQCHHHGAAEEPAVTEEMKRTMETSDLDDFVERHLFDDDLSPPLTRSGIKDQSEPWVSFTRSVSECEPVITHTEECKSATSSEAATSESHSVVSLNSEELSSAESDEGSGVEEDSGSEVEIIEEVKGSGLQQSPPAPLLYLQDLPPDEQYLQEQGAAVLSLVAPQTELKMMDGVEEEGEVVMVGLEPAGLGEEADGPVCYTELKPSTTLLVPLELAGEHQDLLAGGALQALGGGLPTGSCSTFSLMLDADDDDDDCVDEEQPSASELNPDPPLVPQKPEDTERPADAPPHTPCLEHVGRVPDDQLLEELPSAEVEAVALDAPCPVETAPDPPPEETEMKVDVSHTPTLEPSSEMGLGDDFHENCDVDSASSHVEEGYERTTPGKVLHARGNPMSCQEVKIEGHELLKDEVSVAEDQASAGENPVESSSSRDAELAPSTKKKKKNTTAECNDTSSKDVSESAGTNTEETVATATKAQQRPLRSCRKSVTFHLAPVVTEKDLPEEEQADFKVPSTPTRVRRRTMQVQDSEVPVTPRRSVRKVDLELLNAEEIPSTKPSKPSTPPRRTSLKATPRKSSRNTRATNLASDDEVPPMEGLLTNDKAMTQTRQSARKTPKAASGAPDPHAGGDAGLPSPSRVTRKSQRGLSLALDVSVRRTRARQQQEPDTPAPAPILADPDVCTPSLQRTRGKKKESAVKVDRVELEESSSPDDHVEDKIPSKVANVKGVKARKKTSRYRQPVEILLLSPMTSPPAISSALKRTEEEAPTLKMTLRRKRMMEAVFPKPVTRRKKF